MNFDLEAIKKIAKKSQEEEVAIFDSEYGDPQPLDRLVQKVRTGKFVPHAQFANYRFWRYRY